MVAEVITRRAPKGGGAKSWNAESRTFRATIATETPVRRRDWDGSEFYEVLDVAGAVMAVSVPLLNAHRTGDVADVIGRIEGIERVGGRLEAVIKLSRRRGLDGVATDIQDGVLDGLSVGYRVSEWETVESDETVTKTARRWEICEVSIVPIPADPNARIRGTNMGKSTESQTTRAEPIERRERERSNAIIDLASKVGHRSFGEEHARSGTSLDEFRVKLIDHIADEHQRTEPACAPPLGAELYVGGGTAPYQRHAAMAEAIAFRMDPSLEPSGHAREYVGRSLIELARGFLEDCDVDTRARGRGWIADEAMRSRSLGGLHTTSDFGAILSDAVGRVLRNAYASAPSGLKPLSRQLHVEDFRARTLVDLSGFSELRRVNEHGEFTRGTFEAGGEAVRLETFGRIFGISRQVIINDDLGAFADAPRRMGIAAANFESDQLAKLLAENPLMSDGKAIFHADHLNLASPATALTKDALSAARKAMRTQRDRAGNLLNIVPRWLVVGPELETVAEELMAQISPSETSDVQPIRLKVSVEPRLPGFEWYLAADPAEADGIVTAALASEPGPQIDYRSGFDVDGMELKVRLDFGAAFADFRSWFRNPGAPQ